MEKLIPYSKMSKKQKKEIDRRKRNTWNGLNPVTRKSGDNTIYSRKRTRVREDNDGVLFL